MNQTATAPMCQEFCAFKRRHFRSPFTIRAKDDNPSRPGYQTRINRLLREAMTRKFEQPASR